MERNEIQTYLKRKKRITIADIQYDFKVSYREARKLSMDLERLHLIELEDELYYRYICEEVVPNENIWILKECIKENDVDMQHLRTIFSYPVDKIQNILLWLEQKKYTKGDTILLNIEDFELLYGSYPDYQLGKDIQESFDFDEDVDLADDTGNEMFKQFLCEEELEKLIKENKTISFLDFKNYCIRKALECKDQDIIRAHIYFNFVKNHNLYEDKDFKIYKERLLLRG